MSDLLTQNNLELIVKRSAGGVAIFDKDMRYLHVSDQWIKDFKLETVPVIGRSHYEVFPEILSIPKWVEAHQRALKGEIIVSDDEFWERDSHESEYLTYEIHPWYKAEGTIGGIIIFTQVITDRRNIERELRRHSEIFEKFMKKSPIGIALLHIDGKWMQVNPALCNLLGYEKEELLQTDFQNITHPDDLEIDLHNVNAILSGKDTSYILEKRYITKRGKTIWALLSATLIRDEDHRPSFFLSQLVDITPLKEADKLRENFISLASHELRTPLTSVILSLDSLPRYAPANDELFHKYLTIAQKNCHRLSSLIGDIIDAEKLQTKSFSYHPVEMNAGGVVHQTVEENRSLAEIYGIELSLHIEEMPDIFIDPDRLSQVLTNFISNAIRFSPANRPIRVACCLENNEAVISVTDYGMGIPREFQCHIFKKFMRDDNHANRKQGGTGLGLFISKQIVEAMGGRIGFESAVDKGTRFWCSFPVLTKNA